MSVCIRIKDAVKKYGDNTIISDLSLNIKEGEFFTLLGPSGCGKTTTLRMIAGFESPDEGEIYLGDEAINSLTPNKRDTAMVFQSYNLWPHMTIYENLAFGLKLRKVPKAEIDADIKKMLALVSMSGCEKKYPNQMSGGQQQRIAIARSLLLKPSLLLLDEPFSALDSYLKWNLEIELADLLATFNGPILWVSHDRDECYRNCRSVCVMEDGRTGEVTPMDEMIRHPGSVSAARLAGCKNFFAAEARDGKVYLPEWNVALPLAGMENTFTTIGIPDNAVTMSENGAMSCTVCRMILGVEENILLLRPEGSVEGAPMLRITVGHESDLQAGAAVRIALDYSKLLLL